METSNARTGQEHAECGPVPLCGVCTDALREAVRKVVRSLEDLLSKALCFVYGKPCSGPSRMELHTTLPYLQAEQEWEKAGGCWAPRGGHTQGKQQQ